MIMKAAPLVSPRTAMSRFAYGPAFGEHENGDIFVPNESKLTFNHCPETIEAATSVVDFLFNSSSLRATTFGSLC
jgi:hypothetical protein